MENHMKYKMTKLGLMFAASMLAGTSFAAAGELEDLKNQIESLNDRMAQMEAAPNVPVGYQLMAVSAKEAIVVPSFDTNYDNKYYGKTATTIGIMPTADVPSGTNIQWSGFARAALVYWNGDVDKTNPLNSKDKSTEIYARGEAKVVGTTDTAVGEVGAKVVFRADFEGFRNMGFGNTNNGGGNKADVYMPEAWGWWKMTPEMTLGGGFTGTLANIGYGLDGACNCYTTDNAPQWLNPGDRTQMRLSYDSGPISMAVALEDADFSDPTLGGGVASDTLGASGEVKWNGDMFATEISGGYWNGAAGSTSDAYQIGIGGKVVLGEMASLSVGAGMGQNTSNNDYWKASALVNVTLSDSVSAQLGYGYSDWDQLSLGGFGYYGGTGTHYNAKVHSVIAGLYYEPVSQLTLGLEGEWQKWNSDANAAGTVNKDLEAISVGLVSVYRF